MILVAALSQSAFAQHTVEYRKSLLDIQQQIDANQLDSAREAISAAEKKYPANAGLENLLGVIEAQQHHDEAAQQDFAAAIRHNPRLPAAYSNLSRLLMPIAATDSKARAEALRLSVKMLGFDPSNDEARYQLATLYEWNHEPRQSLNELKQLSASAQTQIGAQALACAAHAVLGPAVAAQQAAAMLTANPDLTEQDADTCLPALRNAHRADLIEPLYNAAAALHPLSPEGVRTLGLAQEAAGHLKEARATLESAYSQKPDSVLLLIDLTRVAKAANDNQAALGYLAHARDLAPKDPALPYEFAEICLRMGLYAEARKALAETLVLSPDNADYNYGMGMVVSFSDDPAQAIPYLTRFHQLRPSDARGPLALGTASFRAKDYDTAATWLAKAVANSATAAEAHYYLGRIARQQGQLPQALTHLERSLALRANQPDVLAEIGEIQLQSREFKPAEATLNRAIALDHDNYAANFGLLQLYARTEDPRRDEQSKLFDRIKTQQQQTDQQRMRTLEIRPNDNQPATN